MGDTTPGMPCLGPAPPSFELISEDESTTILAFAVMGLVAVIGLIAFVTAVVVTTCKYRAEANIRRGRQKRRSIAAVGMATMLGGSIGGLAAGFTLGKPQSCESTSLTAENLASAAAAP